MKQISNILSFDLEYWHDSEFVLEKQKKHQDFVIEGLSKLLPLLQKYNTKATFFVTGKVLENYPEAIKQIHEQGHEIASHSYTHKMLSKMHPEQIKADIKYSAELIKSITNESPKGFRAPSFSITEKDWHVYDILKDLNFQYSSSIFPINMGLYGSSSFPTYPFLPTHLNLIEFPITPFNISLVRIPFSGGVYFRILPKSMLKFFINKLNKQNKPAILYIHPWELCPNLPRAKTTAIGKITTYFNLSSTEKKLDYLLSNFKFLSFRDFLSQNQYHDKR